MKDPFKYLGTNWKAGLKIFIFAFVLFFLISYGLKNTITSFSSVFDEGRNLVKSNSGFGGMADIASEEYSQKTGYGIAPSQSYPINNGYTQGDDAEDYEVTQYSANIRTRTLQETCGKVALLKLRADVIFENSYEYEKGCDYNFKVAREKTKEILTIIESLNPDDLSENTYTIKRLINEITNETEILTEKLESINETLETALTAYDEITELATENHDAESLATVIDSKVRLIERLTQERINISSQLDHLSRSAAEQMDRLGYTVFNVSIQDDKFIDIKQIKDSWKNAVKYFIIDANNALQKITVGLVVFILNVLQFVLSLIIVVFIAKFAWVVTKGIWRQKKKK